jgi:hypothetical protein
MHVIAYVFIYCHRKAGGAILPPYVITLQTIYNYIPPILLDLATL